MNERRLQRSPDRPAGAHTTRARRLGRPLLVVAVALTAIGIGMGH